MHWLCITVFLFFAAIACGEDIHTKSGKEYKDIIVTRIEPDGIVVTHSFGIEKIPFAELSNELQQRYRYDPAAITGQAAVDRQHSEKEQKAAEKLIECKERFKAAERGAANAYTISPKGTLTGQVFVATRGRENVKLGATQVALFARDAIDILVAGLKAYADFKLAQVPLTAARTAKEQAEAVELQAKATAQTNWETYQKALFSNDARISADAAKAAAEAAKMSADAARSQYADVLRQWRFFASAAFYFGHLGLPLQRTETDAEGRFAFQVPKSGEFVIAANTQRKVLDGSETYYWLVPVSMKGEEQHVENLSNSNLTTTPGASLIDTMD